MHDDGFPTMSADTSGSSLYSRTPRGLGAAAASANAALMSSIVTSRPRFTTRAVIDPIEGRVVQAQADHRVGVAAGRRDDHALGPADQVPGRLLTRGEQAGGLDDDVDVVRAPRNLVRVAFFELLDLAAVDREAVV